MLEPRGSLGAVCVGRALVAVSGSGVSSNLDSCELLPLHPVPFVKRTGTQTREESSQGGHAPVVVDSGAGGGPKQGNNTAQHAGTWCPIPSVTTARHALSVTVSPPNKESNVPATIFAVGGWKYGDRVRYSLPTLCQQTGFLCA